VPRRIVRRPLRGQRPEDVNSTATGRTGASCTCAPARTRRFIADQLPPRRHGLARHRGPPHPHDGLATRASPTCSSTTCEFRRRCSAPPTRGGRWPPARCPTSAGVACWRCNGASSTA
jgi:hypothetical protein